MCGIIGFTGNKKAEDILTDALALLEYRGYDSAGIALSLDDRVEIIKKAGRVSDLKELINEMEKDAGKKSILDSTCGIGHTRWATHGKVSDKNAHPHRVGDVTLVHNGIIENFKELSEEYHVKESLVSETDSEVAAAVINHFYQLTKDPGQAIKKAVTCFKGTFALVVLFNEYPGVIYSYRNVSPIVAAKFDGGTMLASDVTALCRFTNNYFTVPEYHLLELRADGYRLTDFNGNEIEPEILTMNWGKNSADKGGYPFFMEKEIMEQPQVITNTIAPRIKNHRVDFSIDNIPDDLFTNFKNICIVACGTAMHAGLVFQTLAMNKLGIPVTVWMASEFIYSNPVIDENTLVISVSQSGETIDTLEAVKYAKKFGVKTLSIINVQGSSIAQASDHIIYTNAGPEIAVASTKAYTTQLSVFYLILAKMAHLRGVWGDEDTKEFLDELERVPFAISDVLNNKTEIHKVARAVLTAKDLFMIGRGLDYAILREGSLKLKEVSYIHSEAYASGELKHGPIALIDEGVPVVAVLTQEELFSKEISNIQEVKSRGADIVLFIEETLVSSSIDGFNYIKLPEMMDELMPFPASVALQLLAYFVSSDKGLDVDKPRNLAKVVTVE